tara:strand:+ start:223 stop:690 length:468 start_codon:yes stop_codon:yes gene_type:complete
MKRSILQRQLTLKRPLDEVFPFFADPRNLEALTPDFLKFRVLGMTTPEIEEGTEIDYSLRLRGLPIRWRSRITDWNPPFGFTDVQVQGPYRLWHHEHKFEARGGLTIASDHITYAVLGGSLVDRFLVRPDLERIFDHRTQRMAELLERPAMALTS